ncbi:unnamed protein product [Dovyalis caffra]|uniref:Uncharacterized protein n=1 Tax=Dovyalis caffra TaxID=77055 RepID=A0AAV1SLL0_9ROSI|nr:unnamed protein product [Dovyalis caffra]
MIERETYGAIISSQLLLEYTCSLFPPQLTACSMCPNLEEDSGFGPQYGVRDGPSFF